jgi:hypothetical protein
MVTVEAFLSRKLVGARGFEAAFALRATAGQASDPSVPNRGTI